MADASKIDPKDAEIAALKAQLAAKPAPLDLSALGEIIAKAIAKANAPVVGRNRKNSDGPDGTHLVAPEHRGTHTYVVGPSKHVRGNRQYKAGDLITVTDERPAKDWVKAPAKGEASKPAPASSAPAGTRSSDASVGG